MMKISFKCISKIQTVDSYAVELKLEDMTDQAMNSGIVSANNITIKSQEKSVFDGFVVGSIYSVDFESI